MTGIQELLNAGGNVSITLTAPQLKELAAALAEEIQRQARKEETEQYLSTEKVCQLLEVDPTTLWRWDKKGLLQPLRIGGLNRYRKSNIDKITGSAGK